MLHERMPGHQYELETWVRVSSRPGWPAVGASCSNWRISRLTISSGGITRRPSFRQPLCSSSVPSLIECREVHLPNTVRCCSCASWIFERREVVDGEAVL